MNSRAVTTATIAGTVLQVAMVVAGHYMPAVKALYAVGGMGISLVAGVMVASMAKRASTGGGAIAGGVCAFIGILVSYLLHDVPATLLLLGTVSSVVTGALGGWLPRFFIRQPAAASTV